MAKKQRKEIKYAEADLIKLFIIKRLVGNEEMTKNTKPIMKEKFIQQSMTIICISKLIL